MSYSTTVLPESHHPAHIYGWLFLSALTPGCYAANRYDHLHLYHT